VLFLDARHIYRQIDRAHRDWTPAQIGFLGNGVRLYRGEAPDFTLGGDEARAKLEEVFGSAAAPGSARVPRAGEGVPSSRTSRRVTGHSRIESSDRASGSSFRRDAETNTRDACAPLSYRDVPGLCKAATLAEIEAQGWSLNPGRYIGVAPGEAVSDQDFKAQLETLNEEL